MAIRTLLADDHPIVRTSLRAELDKTGGFEVTAEASSPEELLTLIQRQPFDLLITDFSMPGGQVADGLQMLGMIRRRKPDLPIIVLTMVNNGGVLKAVLDTGARGLMSKTDALSELALAVQAVSHGRPFVSSGIAHLTDDSATGGQADGLPTLSKRETEVLRLFASGFTVTEIAGQLNRSVKTISRQKMDAMGKLGLKNDLDVYAYAREHGILA